jgi:flagellar biogenesis protein FliO
MKAVLHAAFLAVMLGAGLTCRAQTPVGTDPSEVVYPRGAAPAAQQPAQAPATPSPFSPPSSSGGLSQAVAYVAVLGLLVGGAWLLVKRGSLPRPFARSEGRLKVLETKVLGNRQFLMVVEYEDAKMLLGVCQGRIDYLTPLAGHPLAAASMEEEERDHPFNPGRPDTRRS